MKTERRTVSFAFTHCDWHKKFVARRIGAENYLFLDDVLDILELDSPIAKSRAMFEIQKHLVKTRHDSGLRRDPETKSLMISIAAIGPLVKMSKSLRRFKFHDWCTEAIDEVMDRIDDFYPDEEEYGEYMVHFSSLPAKPEPEKLVPMRCMVRRFPEKLHTRIVQRKVMRLRKKIEKDLERGPVKISHYGPERLSPMPSFWADRPF